MKVVITGGAGFIGSNLAYALQDKHQVLIVDKMQDDERFANGNLKSLGHFKNLLDFKGELFTGDIAQKETLDIIDEFSQTSFSIKQPSQTPQLITKTRF